MRRGPNGEPTPEYFIEAYAMAKQKANAEQQPVSYAGFYVVPDRKHKKESLFSQIVWLLIFLSSCYWGPLLIDYFLSIIR